jgi:hypothetical protein
MLGLVQDCAAHGQKRKLLTAWDALEYLSVGMQGKFVASAGRTL